MAVQKILQKEWYTAHEVAKLTGLSHQLITYYMKKYKISCKTENGKRYTHRVDVEQLLNGHKPMPRKGGHNVIPSKINFYNGYIGVVASNSGNEFIFDQVMFPILRNYRWNENGSGYLQSTINNRTVFAHHLVIGRPSKGFIVDHKDLNKRNCRGVNLRFVTIPENGANAKLSSRNASGFKGVCWDKSRRKWKAAIGSKSIGRYDSPQDAAAAYDAALVAKYGDCAVTNKKLGLI